MGEKTTLEWSPNFMLSWSDFQAESNPAVFEDSHSVIKYRFTWIVNSENVDGKIVFLIDDLSLFAEFHPLLSWVRSSEANESLLSHEQGHFDLAELVRRENITSLETKFYKKYFSTRGQNDEQLKQFAKEDSGKMINEEVEKLQSLFDEKSTQYQNGTNYGKNIEEQSKYNLIFKQLRS
jgi:hypothetical protein